MKTMRLILPLPPLGNRYIRRGRTHQYKTQEARDYCAHVARIGHEAGMVPLEGPVAVTVDVYRKRKAGDLDGYMKVLCDSMEGICYLNDNQIIDNHSRRFDDALNPRVEITVAPAKQ